MLWLLLLVRTRTPPTLYLGNGWADFVHPSPCFMVGYSVTSEILQYLENGVSCRVLTVMASEPVRCAIRTLYLSPLRHLDRLKSLKIPFLAS